MGNSLLLSDSVRIKRTGLQEIEFFKKLNSLEKKLFISIFSFKPFQKLTLSLHRKCLEPEKVGHSNEYSEKIAELSKNLTKDNINKLADECRLLSGTRDLFNIAAFTLANPEKFVLNDEYSQYFLVLKTIGYTKWTKSIISQYKVIINLKNSFIRDNQGLVKNFAIRYKALGSFESKDDIIQEGTLGIISAINKFDYKRKIKFCTYAAWWLRASIKYYLVNKTKLIRIPVHIYDKTKVVLSAAEKLNRDNDEQSTIEEISKVTGVSKYIVEGVLDSHHSMISLDNTGLSSLKGENLYSVIEDTTSNFTSPYEDAYHSELKRILNKAIDELPEREKQIIKVRFGMDQENNETKTLKRVGESFGGLCRERIRQLEAKALGRLREQLSYLK